MSGAAQVVYVVDDDPRVREGVLNLLESYCIDAVGFATAHEYLQAPKRPAPSCLVLDVGLPDINGLELQRLTGAEPHPPIVFITGQADVPSAVQAMQGGAVDFLTKPFSDGALIDAIEKALARDRDARRQDEEVAELRRRYETLTRRERQVLTLVVAGLLNKQSASQLGISLVTLQAHRGKVVQKMQARSLPDLVRMALRLQLTPWTPPPK